jgi:nuclear pore complex protein Nup205
VLSLITRLRQGREEAAIAGGEAGKPGPALPTDKLHNLLKQVLEGIARSGTTQVVRGNLYTVLINYLQIVSPQGSAAAAVEPGSLTILLSTMDRVVPIICRDALDGSEIWKTVAYAALETLLAASASDRSHRLVGILYRNGYLQSFVQSLKDTENDLRAVMAPDPGASQRAFISNRGAHC